MKAVELQFSVKRNVDASERQQELLRKPMTDQSALSAASVRQAETERQKTVKTEKSAGKGIRRGDDRGGNSDTGNSDGTTGDTAEASATEAKQAEHPFKGKHIDFSV